MPQKETTVSFRFDRLWPLLSQPWYWQGPEGIALSKEGVVYVTDWHRVLKFSIDGHYMKRWGGAGGGLGQFTTPKGLVADSNGDLYVADSYNYRIQKFDHDGQFLLTWGSEGTDAGQFGYPVDVAVDAEGFVYVADRDIDGPFDRIQKFTSDGQFVRMWGEEGTGEGQFQHPVSIKVSGDFVYVGDFHHPDPLDRVQKFTFDGVFVCMWGSTGSEPGQFMNMNNVSADGSGNIYVDDGERIQIFTGEGSYVRGWTYTSAEDVWSSNFGDICVDSSGNVFVIPDDYTIKKYSPYGQLLSLWRCVGSGPGYPYNPRGVAVDAGGNVYVADMRNSRIQKFNSEGTFLLEWGGATGNPASVRFPTDVDVDAEGNIVVLDQWDSAPHIQKFTPEGGLLEGWFISGYGAFDIEALAIDATGNIYVTNHACNCVQKYSPTGELLLTWGSEGTENGQFQQVEGIAINAQGEVYVSEWLSPTRIQKFTADGEYIMQWGGPGSGPGQFYCLDNLAIDTAGNVYAAEYYGNRFQVFTADGQYIAEYGAYGQDPGQFDRASGIAVAPDGSVYVTDENRNRVQKFRPVTLTQNNKAILVAGGGPGGGAYPVNNLWDATELCANQAYRTLAYQGYTKSTLYYLSSDLQLDLDENGAADDVDGLVTNALLEEAITQWAIEQVNGLPTGDVLIYLVDHGGPGTFRMSPTEMLSASDFAQWLNTLQTGIQGTVTVIYDACKSGSFLPFLAPPTGYENKRILLASTEPEEPANFIIQGSVSFSNLFWSNVFNGMDVYGALVQVSDVLEALGQVPMLEADGDGVPNQAGDYDRVQNVYLGNGTVFSGSAPVIGSISGPQSISETNSVLLWAEGVSDSDGIARVWAVIRPPDYVPADTGNPVQGLPSVDLLPTETEGRYEVICNTFDQPGTYQVAIYARDQNLNVCVPSVTSVTVTDPLKRRAVLVGGLDVSSAYIGIVERSLSEAHRALRNQGYTEEEIYLLSPVSMEGVDALPELTNFAFALGAWLEEDTSDLAVYLCGKAAADVFCLNDTESFSADMLDTWLDSIQALLPGTVTVIIDSPYSGSFIPFLLPPDGKERIAIASTNVGEGQAFLSPGTPTFSMYFWARIFNGATVGRAFNSARQAMQVSAWGPDAQIDDNANGISNEKSDGKLAMYHILGSGILLAGDDPVVGAVVPNQELTGDDEAVLWVDLVTATEPIARVWGCILPPYTIPHSGKTSESEAIEVELVFQSGSRYEALCDFFTLPGIYHVAIYAMDATGNISLPAETDVQQLSSAGLPDAYEPDNSRETAQWIGINGQNQRHTFHEAADEDWVRFYAEAGQRVTVDTQDLGPDADTYLELYFESGSSPLASNDDEGPGQLQSRIQYLIEETGIYYARSLFSPSGSFPTGDTFDTSYTFRVWEEQGPMLPATLYCSVVRSDAPDTPVTTAALTLSPLSIVVTRNVDGLYTFLALPAGSYSVHTTAPGFLSSTDVINLQNGIDSTLTILLDPEGLEEGEGTEEEGELEGAPEEGEVDSLAIVQQPRGASLYVGMSWTVSILVTGGEGMVTYDWKKDGVSIGWPSSMVHVLGPLAEADAGVYSCTVSDDVILIDSSEVALSVYPAALTGQHAVDQNGNWAISLSELLRVVQLFNSGGFHCNAGTEDGYAPGAGDQTCASYDADYAPQDWSISLSELLRIIQFFNSGCYHAEAGTEDGYAPGAG